MGPSPSSPPLALVEHCPGCGGQRRKSVSGPYGEFELVRCTDCSLVHATAGYAPQFLDDHYAERMTHAPARGRRGARPGSERKRHALALYDRLTEGRITSPAAAANALDIGCSTGLLLDLLAEAGYRTFGVERSASAEEARAAGHEVHALDIEAGVDLPVRFDLVTMTHLLEHLRQPATALAWVRSQMKPGGLAVVEVPNWADLARPLWGPRYRPLELGDHLSFFERDTLAAVARRAGFRVRALWSAPQARTLVFPSMLTSVDIAAQLLRRARGSTPPAAGVGVGAARVAPSGQRWQHRVVSAVLSGLDRFDGVLERAAGTDWPHGANLVAILDPNL